MNNESQGWKAVYPPEPSSELGPIDQQIESIQCLQTLKEFLQETTDLLPSSLRRLVAHSRKLGVFVSVPELPEDSRIFASRVLGIECQEWDATVHNAFSEIHKAASEGAEIKLGVSVHDVYVAMDYEPSEIPARVKKFIDSKKLKAAGIGKSRGKQLYELSELLKDFAKYSPMTPIEKQRLRQRLLPMQRQPDK